MKRKMCLDKVREFCFEEIHSLSYVALNDLKSRKSVPVFDV